MKEGFKNVKDILKEVAEEEGLSVKEINDLWRHQKIYIKKQQSLKGVYSIFLPFIGTLSLNVKQAEKEIKGKSKEFYKEFLEKIKLLKLHPNYREYSNAHKKVTGVNRLARYVIRNYDTGIEKTKKILLHKQCWDIISKYSNKIFKKK